MDVLVLENAIRLKREQPHWEDDETWEEEEEFHLD